MAALVVDSAVMVMPSNGQYWHETFGIVSMGVERATGLRVVTNDGGLPETDCGGLVLVAPDDAEALAAGIVPSGPGGAAPLHPQRSAAAREFTVAQSVDSLLAVLSRPRPVAPSEIVRQLEELVRLPSPPDPVVPVRAA